MWFQLCEERDIDKKSDINCKFFAFVKKHTIYVIFGGYSVFFSFSAATTFLQTAFSKVITGTTLITESKESQVPSVSGSVQTHTCDKVKKLVSEL